MSGQIVGKEPDPLSSRVRKFHDNRHIPYRNLAELRRAMVADDRQLISFIGSRMVEAHGIEPVADPTESARYTAQELARTARAGTPRFPELVSVVYEVLADSMSPHIPEVDPRIVGTLADRTYKAMLATAFKYDRGEGIAPAQQALNQARAVQIAQESEIAIPEEYGDLAAVVHEVYGVLVPKTANELQQGMFNATSIDDWDASMAAALRDVV